MKILAISASPRHGSTYHILKEIEKISSKNDDIDYQLLELKDKQIHACKGCCICYDKNECFCPQKDDVKEIVAQMRKADGVIFASPTYVMNVSGHMKNLIDRLSYLSHRSEFFEKEAILITTCAGKIGSRSTIKSLMMPAMSWGFHISGKLSMITGHYTPYTLQSKDQETIKKIFLKFIMDIKKQAYKKASIPALVGFRYRKIAYNDAINQGKTSEDLLYWEKHGYLNTSAQYFFTLKRQRLKLLLAKIVTYFVMRV